MAARQSADGSEVIVLRHPLIFAFVMALTLSMLAQESPKSDKNSEDKGGATARQGNVQILSDTQGYDFRQYLQPVGVKVRENWLKLMPKEAYAPTRKSGTVVIDFAILRDGSIAGMKLIESSGSGPLDKAAWGAIVATKPFPRLPKAFKGQFLALRFPFQYNPIK